jgi:hypothetical protein
MSHKEEQVTDTELTVTIAGQEVRVGDAANSKVSIDIRNNTGGDLTYTFYIILPTAFVAEDKVGKIVFEQLKATADNVEQPPEGTRWIIGDKRGTTVAANKTLNLTLSRIDASATDTPMIGIEWFKRATKLGSASLPVNVLAADDVPKIISFEAEKYVVTRTQTGVKEPIKLKWETDDESVVELFRLGAKLLPTEGKDSAARKMARWWQDSDYESSGIQPYQLTATAKGRTVSRWLFVRVQDPGWNRIECTQGAPTLLLNDGDNRLYGVFLRDAEAAVYRLDTESGALGRKDTFCCQVPEGMETSPGAFFQNKIWLVGGSQIDPEVCSNTVWWFDPQSNNSGSAEANWSARMGHACAVFDNKLWILGGVDLNGNTLADVRYSSDGTTWKEGPPLFWPGEAPLGWKEVPPIPSGWKPQPLCLLTTAAFDDKIWAYGGAEARLGTPHKGLWCYNKSAWQQMKFYGEVDEAPKEDPGLGDPYGSALCVGKGTINPPSSELFVLGTFQGKTITDAMYKLTGWRSPAISLEQQGAIGAENTWPKREQSGDTLQPFRLSSVGFGSFIFVVSLVEGVDNRWLPYLVR